MWKTHLESVYNCMGSVSHLLKEEHNDEECPLLSVSPGNETLQEHDSNGNGVPQTLQDVRNVLTEWLSEGGDMSTSSSQKNEPTSATSMPSDASSPQKGTASEEKNTSEQEKSNAVSAEWYCRDNSPISNNSTEHVDVAELMNLTLGELGDSANSGYPDWFHAALRGESNIAPDHPIGYVDVSQATSSSSNNALPPRPHFGQPHFLELNRPEDPTLFHLNAFDSPPPSPGNEFEDYNFNMQVDPNGVIPADVDFQVPDLPVRDNNNLDFNNASCHLELCQSFEYLLKTTPENVQDKQNVLKEMFHHADSLMRKAVEICPPNYTEELLELTASIVLINNSLERSTNMESYMNISAVCHHLVIKMKSALEKFI